LYRPVDTHTRTGSLSNNIHFFNKAVLFSISGGTIWQYIKNFYKKEYIMDEDMMGMDVAPVMDPQQMNGMPPQGMAPQGMMMPGTPPAQELPQELQSEINNLGEDEKSEAKQALMQIMKIVEQMMSEGASEQEVEEFLKQIGMTLEELEMAEEMFGMGEGALGFTI
jgi:hypothetical protein